MISEDCLQTVEVEKLRKYDLLANEMGQIYKCKVHVIPIVITWDGIVTKFHKSYCKQLGIEKYIKAYIQSVVLKRTFESISLEFRRNNTLSSESRDNRVDAAIEEIWSKEEEVID